MDVFEAATATEALVERTLDLVALDSQNPPGETAAVADYVADLATDVGLEVDRLAVDPAKPNLVVTVPGRRAETLVFNGHFDTVPYDAEAWDHDPLGERDGSRIYGRGATDMKGPLAAMLQVLRAYGEADQAPAMTLQFVFVSDEETGGDAGLPAVFDARDLSAAGCVIGETTCMGGHHSVTVADKGAIWLTLEATGTAAHGSRPMLGQNAIDRLYAAIEVLREGFCNYTFDLDPTVERIVEESVDYYAPSLGAEAAQDLFDHPTCNLGTIQGGETINAVPDSATARLDIRFAPGIDTADLLATIRDRIDRHDGVEITDATRSTGSYVDPDDPIVRSVVETAEAVSGDRIYRRSATGGGDAKDFRRAGIPAVEFAFGTETVHAVDEYTTTDALEGTARVYAELPAAFASLLATE
jgi:succinyl-diaminopimelate desuccinylase